MICPMPYNDSLACCLPSQNLPPEVIEMASLKYKGSPRKKTNSELDVIVSSLREENAYLKKTLVELSRQHSEHNKLIERFLSLETVRLESCQQLTAKDEKVALLSKQLSKKEGKLMDVDSTSDEWTSTNTTIELQNHLNYALEKNKQWLEYDQQREAYVRATLARMLWLEKELNKANQARSQQHNEDHSDVRERISQVQEHYESLLQKAKDELEVLREQLDMAHQNLKVTQDWCKEKESEVEELKQQLQTENISIKSAPEDHHCSEDEEQWLTAETEDLQCRLDEEKRRSTNFEMQLTFFQKCLKNCHSEDQEKIADLERQARHSDHVATTIFETLTITAVFLVSVASNAGAAALVTWECRLLANKTILTLNLFVADLLFVSMIPLIVAVRWTESWMLGFTACHTVLYVICMSGCATITTLASISVERVQAILRLQAVPILNRRVVIATLFFIWAFSALTSIPLSIFFTVMEVDFPEQKHVHICTLRWPDTTAEIVWNVTFTALCFLLPGFIIVVSYSKILQIAKRCRLGLRDRQPVRNSLEYHVSRQDMKLFRTLLVLVLSFLIMWSPIFIVTFLILARNFLDNLDVSSTMFFWVVTFTLANSALNPILYSVRQFKKVWRRFCCDSVIVPLSSGQVQGIQP
ncbi:uncharacterized protein LOC116704872 isoform X4 [Etheostoma spectabile]|uniref:uncharacterized protein LOC116704872 isoform X4 n=1 Tax=Etheostoma spectabile TaxID=54343 RepID=UPI0013AF8289|nr:uncharacterized protein LOC116704872 isoform X4 [Etheostoma spectabile]